MKRVIFCLLALGSQISAEEPAPQQSIENSFGYVDVGFELPVIPIPALGLGYRKQWDRDGFDLSFRVANLGEYVTQAKATASFLRYFNPNLESEFYWGVGLGISWVRIDLVPGLRRLGWNTVDQSLCLSPEFLFGKQFKTDSGSTRFWQFQFSFPTCAASNPDLFRGKKGLYRDGWLVLPIITFSYGFGF